RARGSVRRLLRLAGADRLSPGRAGVCPAAAAPAAAAPTTAAAAEPAADRAGAVRSVHGGNRQELDGDGDGPGSGRRHADLPVDGADRDAGQSGGAADAVDGAAAGRVGAGHGDGERRQGRHRVGHGDIQVVRPTPKTYTFEDVHFDFDRYTLRPEATRVLDEAVAALREDPTLRVNIEGHTCNIGTAEYNLALGDRRANDVKEYLVSRGVTADRLQTVSYGEERPKYDNAREETRRLNRRAALVVNLQR